MWGLENPHTLVESEQHPQYVTVWCGLTSRGIIGPHFFQTRGRAGGVVQTVTAARYQSMLEKVLVPKLERQHIQTSGLWFQQDGATPHTSRGVLSYLQEVFPGKVISKGGDVPWPPRSPDLSPLDFFLWGHLKATVYGTPVRSLRELRQRLRTAVRHVPQRALRAALDQLPHRCRWCLRRRGAHMETLLTHN